MASVGYGDAAISLLPMTGEPPQSSPQGLTDGWVNLGETVKMQGYMHVALHVDVLIKDSLNVRFRLVSKTARGGQKIYELPIGNKSASDEKIQPHYKELNLDRDQCLALPWAIDRNVVWGQFQAMAETPGTEPGQIVDAWYTLGA